MYNTNSSYMKIVFFSLILNHHQAPLADSFYHLLGDNYTFVELRDCKYTKGDNSDYTSRPYLLQAWKSVMEYKKAIKLATDADACVFGGVEAMPFMKERLRRNLLSFDMGERWLKRGIVNLLSPYLMKMFLTYWTEGWYKKRLLKLCNSAFAARDHSRLCMYKGKCYKWGYFTQVDSDFEVEATEHDSSTSEIIPLMWCARFLKWKHPELPVQLAARLKAKGYCFVLDMFGNGEELEHTKKLISDLDVGDCVNLCGNCPNEVILKEMRKHRIFLFTSDQNEGWGAVTNEAMANGCVVVGSDAIGSVPYLVEYGVNGMIFHTEDIDSLEAEVVKLLKDKQRVDAMSVNARETMQLWSPKEAANRFIKLCEAINSGCETPFEEGPCSKDV